MITYLTKPDCVVVKLDGKNVGTIKLVSKGTFQGYSYFPKGSKTGGDIYPTIFGVKQSLETE